MCVLYAQKCFQPTYSPEIGKQFSAKIGAVFKNNIFKMSKKERIYFRVSSNEKKEITRLAGALGYDSVSDYLSAISLSGLTKKERIEIHYEINNLRKRNAKVENNINQIATHLNVNKSISDSKLDEYLSSLQEFSILRKKQSESITSLIKILFEDKQKLYDLLNQEKNDQN